MPETEIKIHGSVKGRWDVETTHSSAWLLTLALSKRLMTGMMGSDEEEKKRCVHPSLLLSSPLSLSSRRGRARRVKSERVHHSPDSHTDMMLQEPISRLVFSMHQSSIHRSHDLERSGGARISAKMRMIDHPSLPVCVYVDAGKGTVISKERLESRGTRGKEERGFDRSSLVIFQSLFSPTAAPGARIKM